VCVLQQVTFRIFLTDISKIRHNVMQLTGYFEVVCNLEHTFFQIIGQSTFLCERNSLM